MLTRLSAAAIAVALLATARPAQADPVTDFKTGTAVRLRLTTVDLGSGSRSSGRVLISKTAGTLDFELQATDLGIPVPISILLHGSSVGGGRILYTVDDTYSPAVDIGNGQLLSRVTGRLYAAASRIPGAFTQIGNARLLSVDNSGYLDAHGDWGTFRILITNLDLIGGLPQRPLDAFVDPGAGIVCSDRVRTTHALAVSLTDVAPAYGTVVDLEGPRSGGVRLPNVVVVPAGHRSAIVNAFVDANFVGTVRLTAASGGITRSLGLAVHAHGDCE